MAFKRLNSLHTPAEAMSFLVAFARTEDWVAISEKDHASIERSCRAFLDGDMPKGYEVSGTLGADVLEALRAATGEFLNEAANNHQLVTTEELSLSFWAIPAVAGAWRIIPRGAPRPRWIYL